MKKKILLIVICSLLLHQNGISQIYDYVPGKTFDNVNGVSGLTYTCYDNMGGIILCNQKNTLTFVSQEKTDGSKMNIHGEHYYDMSSSMANMTYNTVNKYLTNSEKARVKGERLIVCLYLDSNTGGVKEVNYRFSRNSPYATIPPERYYQIEQALKKNFKVSMLPEGKKLNYNLSICPFKIRAVVNPRTGAVTYE